MNTDSIEKKIVLKAPRERVWRAISDSRQFGAAQNRQNHPQGMHVDPAAYESRKDHVVLCEP